MLDFYLTFALGRVHFNPVSCGPGRSLVSLDQCQMPGTCLVVTVLDYDTLRTDDFEGEAFLALKAIPGVAGGKEGDKLSRQPDAPPAQIRLPLMHPKPNGTVRRHGGLELLIISKVSVALQEPAEFGPLTVLCGLASYLTLKLLTLRAAMLEKKRVRVMELCQFHDFTKTIKLYFTLGLRHGELIEHSG